MGVRNSLCAVSHFCIVFFPCLVSWCRLDRLDFLFLEVLLAQRACRPRCQCLCVSLCRQGV